MIKKLDDTAKIENVNLKNILPINCKDVIITISNDNQIIKTLNPNVTGESLKNWVKNAGKYLIDDLKGILRGDIINDYYYIIFNNKKYLCRIINKTFLKAALPTMLIFEQNGLNFLVVNDFSCEDIKSFELFEDIIPEIKPNQIEEEDRDLMNDYNNSVSLLD